jgi:hypothetical protein
MTTTATRQLSLPHGSLFPLELTADLGKEELQQRMLQALRGGEICNRALAFYLADMERRQLHREFGCDDTATFAVQHLGLSRGRARDLLTTGRKLAGLRRLDAAFANGKLSWSKVRRLARVATPQSEHAWITHAKHLSHEEVDALVSLAKEGDWPARSTAAGRTPPRKRITLSVQQREAWEIARAVVAQKSHRAVVSDADVLDALLRRFLEIPLGESRVPGDASGQSPHVAARPRAARVTRRPPSAQLRATSTPAVLKGRNPQPRAADRSATPTPAGSPHDSRSVGKHAAGLDAPAGDRHRHPRPSRRATRKRQS